MQLTLLTLGPLVLQKPQQVASCSSWPSIGCWHFSSSADERHNRGPGHELHIV